MSLGEKPGKFKKMVLSVVGAIPRGETRTYKEVAVLAGKPGAYRAVGNILHTNYDQHIPCHRVTRSNGTVGGYNRGRLNKIMLLKKEGYV